MSKIRTIYLYLVCLIALSMAVGGFISTINYMSQYFFPTSYVYYDSYYNDYDNDIRSSLKDKQTSQENQIQKENEKIRNLKSAITSLALVAVSVPIFIYHWKKVEIERKELEV